MLQGKQNLLSGEENAKIHSKTGLKNKYISTSFQYKYSYVGVCVMGHICKLSHYWKFKDISM